jgi:16S rRNA (cytosine967-C5)-methyltransferase
MTPFLERHAISFLNALELSGAPLDLALSRYFKTHKQLGASDRRFLGETFYGMTRWKGLVDWLSRSSSTQDRLACYLCLDWDRVKSDSSIPLPARLGLSPFLYDRFLSQFGEEKTRQLAQILNSPAPTTIRVNTLKTTRDALLEKWKGKFSIAPCAHSPTGISFEKREPLFSLPEFKEGLFEMQDEGSQLVASLVTPKPGETVLDYCSGSGGKTLAFAPELQGKGQIYLHDVRPRPLLEARKRLKRAGIQNAQCLLPDHPQLQRLKAKCDWVLIDVPCTGTGTLRRNPDQKWKIDAPALDRLVLLQKEIAVKAVSFLKPGGKLVFATCSLFYEENEAQAKWLESLALEPIGPSLSLLPEAGGPDGFFGAVFLKKSN